MTPQKSAESEELATTTLRMPAGTYRRVKMASVERDCTIGDILAEAASEWLDRQTEKAAAA